MMHCHVCDEDVPLDEIINHVRLFHPDAYPVSDHIEVHVHEPVPDRDLARLIQRTVLRNRLGRDG